MLSALLVNHKFFVAVVAVMFARGFIVSAANPTYTPDQWSGLHYRMIGPDRGGRVTAVTGVPTQPLIYYMGSTGGGVWKTTDAGNSWHNISDGYFKVASIGAIEVAQSDPNIIYAGTGSSKIRSNVSIGRGIYRSNDAGKTWSFAGLPDTGQIATIRVNPSDANDVFVAAQGNPFIPNRERGVYHSTDGGKTWKNVLHISDELGAADLELEPGNPKVIYACMWHGQRKPWTIISGSPDGAIYKSSDAGENWKKLEGGLPNQVVGRMSVAISAAKPNRVYALVEAKPGSGLYRSEDAGASWALVNSSKAILTRPFYYSTLGVDPNNSDIVYVGDEGWFKSIDAGKNFKRAPVPHGDNHDLWINPKNSTYMIQANDGGANVSIDEGRSWSSQANQPTAEIYQVAVDNQFPYRLYGAQQDNTTVIVPSLSLSNGQDFRIGPGCETGPIIPKPDDPKVVYGGCKGQFTRMDTDSNDEERYWIGAESLYGNAGSDLIDRFQRVAPMEVSPFRPYAVYYGSQYLYRSTTGGEVWERISPDLTAHPPGTQGASGEPITRDATGEEVYSTLYAIRESPVKPGVIWTGSNDGLISITMDNGKTWKNVTPKDLPPGGRIQNIEPSPHRAGTAYAAIHRFLLGDFAPYIYRTDDYGQTWTRLTDGTNGIGKDEPTRVVREDPDRSGLLYAGTEFGIYISFDNGSQWQSFQLNLPVTPVTDMKINRKDLVISTQGRSFWILDDLTPLHQLQKANQQPVLYAPCEAVRTQNFISGEGGGSRGGSGYPEYLASGAIIDYYLPASITGDIQLDITDANGKLVRSFTSETSNSKGSESEDQDDESAGRQRAAASLDKSPGMHRFTWDLRYWGAWQSEKRPQGANGPKAVPGGYFIKLTAGSWSATQPLTVMEDPRTTNAGVTTADLKSQFEFAIQVRDMVSEINQAVAKVKAAQARMQNPAGQVEIDRLNQINALASRLITPSTRYSKPELQTQITYLYSLADGADQKLGKDAQQRFTVLRDVLNKRQDEINALLGH